jgi:hypothetical protein
MLIENGYELRNFRILVLLFSVPSFIDFLLIFFLKKKEWMFSKLEMTQYYIRVWFFYPSKICLDGLKRKQLCEFYFEHFLLVKIYICKTFIKITIDGM